jgi:hypothetical protein
VQVYLAFKKGRLVYCRGGWRPLDDTLRWAPLRMSNSSSSWTSPHLICLNGYYKFEVKAFFQV